MSGHIFLIEAGTDIVLPHGQTILARRGRKFATAVEDDKDMKQVGDDYCFMRDQP